MGSACLDCVVYSLKKGSSYFRGEERGGSLRSRFISSHKVLTLLGVATFGGSLVSELYGMLQIRSNLYTTATFGQTFQFVVERLPLWEGHQL